MNGRNTRGLRIRTRCTTIEELVGWFHRFCDETSIFIATTSPRAEGFDTAFSIDLASGEPALAGEGVVLASWTTRANRYNQPGMQIGVRNMTRPSQTVFEKLLIARAVAADSDQQSWEDGTDVGNPAFDDGVGVAPAFDVHTGPVTVSAKHTMLGIPIVPMAPAGNATPVPVAANGAPAAANAATSAAANAAARPHVPGAFNVSVPARIAPVGSKRAKEPGFPRASTPVIEPAAAIETQPLHAPLRPPVGAAPPVLEPVVSRVETKPLPKLTPQSIAEPVLVPKPPIVAEQKPVVIEPRRARLHTPPSPEPAVVLEPSVVVESAPESENKSSRVPRAGTVLGSGPVPRTPARELDEEAASIVAPIDHEPATDAVEMSFPPDVVASESAVTHELAAARQPITSTPPAPVEYELTARKPIVSAPVVSAAIEPAAPTPVVTPPAPEPARKQVATPPAPTPVAQESARKQVATPVAPTPVAQESARKLVATPPAPLPVAQEPARTLVATPPGATLAAQAPGRKQVATPPAPMPVAEEPARKQVATPIARLQQVATPVAPTPVAQEPARKQVATPVAPAPVAHEPSTRKTITTAAVPAPVAHEPARKAIMTPVVAAPVVVDTVVVDTPPGAAARKAVTTPVAPAAVVVESAPVETASVLVDLEPSGPITRLRGSVEPREPIVSAPASVDEGAGQPIAQEAIAPARYEPIDEEEPAPLEPIVFERAVREPIATAIERPTTEAAFTYPPSPSSRTPTSLLVAFALISVLCVLGWGLFGLQLHENNATVADQPAVAPVATAPVAAPSIATAAPSATPPVAAPSVATPPVEAPAPTPAPVEQPPAVAPPAEAPVAESPTADTAHPATAPPVEQAKPGAIKRVVRPKPVVKRPPPKPRPKQQPKRTTPCVELDCL